VFDSVSLPIDGDVDAVDADGVTDSFEEKQAAPRIERPVEDLGLTDSGTLGVSCSTDIPAPRIERPVEEDELTESVPLGLIWFMNFFALI
jgi:hypothetical protein